MLDQELLDRFRSLHSSMGIALEEKAGGPAIRHVPLPGAAGGKASLTKSGVKVHHGEHGQVYELPAGARLAETFQTKNTPDVPMERWLAATMLGDRCEDKAALDFARESKSLSGGSSTGVLIPEAFQGEWIDNLRSFMVLEAAGMTTATMSARTVTTSRIISDPPVGWRSEGAPLVAGDPTMELRQLVANSLAVRVQATAELAQDSPEFGSQLLNIMGRALAQEIDRAGLMGTGLANQPTGIVNTPGIFIVPTIGTPGNYSSFVTGLQRLLEANVPLEQAEQNAIMSPRTWAGLENLTATDGQPLMRPRALDRMTFRPTTSIPNNLGVGNNESIGIMGDFRDLVLGVRMEASVEALRLQSFADSLKLEFIGWTRVDFLVRRPASFVVLEGITAP